MKGAKIIDFPHQPEKYEIVGEEAKAKVIFPRAPTVAFQCECGHCFWVTIDVLDDYTEIKCPICKKKYSIKLDVEVKEQ